MGISARLLAAVLLIGKAPDELGLGWDEWEGVEEGGAGGVHTRVAVSALLRQRAPVRAPARL